jgi:rhamnogalacturonyl hydrolase YesR
MTPKEKAEELVKKFAKKSNNLKQRTDWDYDKQCALIAVDEIVKQLEQYGYYKSLMTYWDAVKQEIEKL